MKKTKQSTKSTVGDRKKAAYELNINCDLTKIQKLTTFTTHIFDKTIHVHLFCDT